jgi:hypothetical protein
VVLSVTISVLPSATPSSSHSPRGKTKRDPSSQHHGIPGRINELEPDDLSVTGDIAGGQFAALDFHQADRRISIAIKRRKAPSSDDMATTGGSESRTCTKRNAFQ